MYDGTYDTGTDARLSVVDKAPDFNNGVYYDNQGIELRNF